MWEFIKANPVTFAAAGVLLILAIVGVIVGVVTKGRWLDRGLLKTETGHPAKWMQADLPIPVWYAADISSLWLTAWTRAAGALADATGRELFMVPIEAPTDLELESPVNRALVLKDDQGLDPGHGVTDLRWDKRDGTIMSATVTLPEALAGNGSNAEQRYSVALHEAAHALGLDHDERPKSIMFPTLTGRPAKLTKKDRALLKRIYG